MCKVFERNVVSVNTKYESSYYFDTEILDYMLRTGVTFEEALKKFKIADRNVLDAVYSALNRIDRYRDYLDSEYSYNGYSVKATCTHVGSTVLEPAILVPSYDVLDDKFYNELREECQKNDTNWAVLYVEPSDIAENPFRIECYSRHEGAFQEAMRYTNYKYLRKAFVYNMSQNKIERVYYWFRNDFAKSKPNNSNPYNCLYMGSSGGSSRICFGIYDYDISISTEE